MANISIDISTLSGWSSLTTGTHAITVKAKASGYLDSNASNSVNVTKAASGIPVTYTDLVSDSEDSDGYSYLIYNGTTYTGSGTFYVQEGDTITLVYDNYYVYGSTMIGAAYVEINGSAVSESFNTTTYNFTVPTGISSITMDGNYSQADVSNAFEVTYA